MTNKIILNKPQPLVLNENPIRFNNSTHIEPTIAHLKRGKPVLINKFYNDGLILLKALHHHLQKMLPNNTIKEQHLYRATYQKLSNLILLEIRHQKLKVRKSPIIGWLEKFYPQCDHFYLTLPQVQGLNSSWQWYQKGISVPVLRNKIHPYYGTYFPTRFEHLIIFDNWLKRYQGDKKTAIDVGTGCGVLALMMVKHRFQKVFATDINPNAIIGLADYMGNTKLSRKIELDLGHLFGKWSKPTELIVFNPPWLPTPRFIEGIDKAIYYDENLFPEFFSSAKERLLPNGNLVLIFSNLAQITNLTKEHPIKTELAKGNRFKLKRRFEKSVKQASKKTKRNPYWRSAEKVELWVLKHN